LTRQIGQFGAPQAIMTKGLLTAQISGSAGDCRELSASLAIPSTDE
jgi:hypothetical protein